jgi:hypothetical protein
MDVDDDSLNDEKNWSFKTTALRAGSCLTICFLFVVEFQFNFKSYLDIFSLTLFAIAIPVLIPIIVTGHWWRISKNIGFEERLAKLSISANIGGFITVLAVGLCFFSMHWLAGIMYVLSATYSLYLFIHYLGLCPAIFQSTILDMTD